MGPKQKSPFNHHLKREVLYVCGKSSDYLCVYNILSYTHLNNITKKPTNTIGSTDDCCPCIDVLSISLIKNTDLDYTYIYFFTFSSSSPSYYNDSNFQITFANMNKPLSATFNFQYSNSNSNSNSTSGFPLLSSTAALGKAREVVTYNSEYNFYSVIPGTYQVIIGTADGTTPSCGTYTFGPVESSADGTPTQSITINSS